MLDTLMIWTAKHPKAHHEMLGFIPLMLNEADTRPAREQINANYHGGGWRPFRGFTMIEDGIVYPDDPPMPLLFETKLRDETIRFYDCSWLAVVQPDGSYEIARVD